MTLVLVNDFQNRALREPVRLDRRRRRLSAVVKKYAPRDRAYWVSVHKPGDILVAEDHTVRLRKTWAKTLVGPNDIVVIKRLPLRPIHGGGGGNEAKQIGGLVAMIAVALAAPYLVAGLGITALGTTATTLTFAGKLVAAGLTMAAGFGISAALGSNASTKKNDPLYNVAGGTNVARPLARIPVGYGRSWHRLDLAQPDFTVYDGDDMVLNKVLVLGLGKYQVHRVQVGSANFWTEDDGIVAPFSSPPGGGGSGQIGYDSGTIRPSSGGACQIEFLDPGDTPTLVPDSVYSSPSVGGELPRPSDTGYQGPFPCCPVGKETDLLHIDFSLPEGCFHQAQTHAGEDAYTYNAIWEYAPCDDDDNPTGAYVTLLHATEHVKKTKGFRITREIPVTKGRYLVRAKNNNNDLSDDSNRDTVTWDGLRSFFRGTIVRNNVTTIGMKIRSGKSLGVTTFGDIYVEATRIVRAWNAVSEEWEEQPTRKAVYAFLDILTSGYGGNLPDSEIDLDGIKARAASLTEFDTFDGVIDGPVTVWDACATVLGPMRAEPTRVENRWSLVRDEARSVKKHVFTRRQIARGSTAASWGIALEKGEADVIVEYSPDGDPRRNNQTRATFGAQSLTPQRKRLAGVTTWEHAQHLATWMAAAAYKRRKGRKIAVEYQGRLVRRGDPIFIDAWFMSQSRAAGILERDGYNVSLDTNVAMEETGDTYALFRDRKGREWGPVRVTAGTAANKVVLNSDDVADAETAADLTLDNLLAHDDEDITTVLIGPYPQESFTVDSVQPQGKSSILITAKQDNPDVWDILAEALPTTPMLPARGDEVEPDVSVLVWVSARCIQKGVGLAMDWAISGARGASSYVVKMSYDDGDIWEDVSNDLSTSGAYPIRHEEGATLKIGAYAISKKGNVGPPVYATFSSFKVDITGDNSTVWADALEASIKAKLAAAQQAAAAQALQARSLIDKWITAKQSDDSLLGDIKRVEQTAGNAFASIEQAEILRAEENAALVALIDILTTAVGGNSASITSLISSVDGVKVQFGVTGTINGVTGGFVFTGIQKLDGSVSYTVEIDGDLIVDGTITADKLNVINLQAVSAQTGNLTVDGVIMVGTKIEIDGVNGWIAVYD